MQAEVDPEGGEKLSTVVDNWLPRFLANGLDALQVQGVLARIERWDQWADAWTDSAQGWEDLARAALKAGHDLTAGAHFQRAALTLQFAQFVLTEDEAAREAIHRRQAALYQTAAPLLRPPAQPVAIPFGDATLPGYLRRPDGRPEVGLVLLVPGLESTKEQFSTYEPYFLERGVATLSFEGPGQGETWYRMPFRDQAFQDAFAAVLRYVDGLDGVGAGGVAVVGTSFGGYLALKSAGVIPGLAGVVDIAGPYDLAAFDQMQPVIRDGFRRIVQAPDLTAAKELLADVSLDGALDDLTAPVLIVHGERDAVIVPEHARRIHQALGGRGELWLEADGNHACNNKYGVMRPAVADWVADRLTERT
ncbi:MAG TPA: alpha/beta fold hydrolase [Nocardioides sp.]|nr:alpha/beta fold hydrolase [Nocardioides sp.]